MIHFYLEPKLGGMIITLTNADEKEYFKQESVELHGTTINVGDMTDLDGFYTEKVRYAGFFKDNNSELKVMVFCIGEEQDLFNKIKYYNCLYYISPIRIVAKYSKRSARDYNWINNQWK